jgi:hypothetical protein
VAGSCKYGDEPVGSVSTELINYYYGDGLKEDEMGWA